MVSPSIDAFVLGGFAVLVVATAGLLWVQRPTVSRPLVLASLPWLATATILRSLRSTVDYPAGVETILRFPSVYVLMACLCALAWTMLVQLRTSEQARAAVPAYLGVMGAGTLLAPGAVLVAVGGASTPLPQLLTWLVAPVVALVATYVALLSLGLWLPRAAAFAGSAGGVVLFGATLDAVVTGTAASIGGPTPLAFPALVTPLAATVGVSETAVAVWVAVWLRILAAVAILATLALVSRSRRSLAERGLHVAVVVGVLAGTNALVVALAGGVLP